MSESTAGKGDSRRSEKDAGSYSENFEGIDWSKQHDNPFAACAESIRRDMDKNVIKILNERD